MKITNALLILVALMGLSGCESAEAHEHHLYNLDTCRLTIKQEEPFITTPQKPGVLVSSGAVCMAELEHTTIEYQQAKGDDYGRVKN
jgi:hypothetical protein